MSVLEERCGITEYEYRQRKKREQEEKERQERAIQKKINSVLDKIKAEIIEMRSKQNVGVLECLDVIDKYREPKFNVGTVGIISHGRRTFADLVAEGLRNEV